METKSQFMSKKDWAFIISSVLVFIIIDQLSKAWAVSSLGRIEFYGPLGLVLHRNPGAMLGMFSDLPPILRIVSLSTGGAFLVFIYAALQYLLPLRSLQLRLGMSMLLGGILGNVLDRINAGSVVDFIVIGTAKFSSPAFNFADAIQWVGYILVVISLIFDGQQLWPENNERKRMWIKPIFQLKYISVLIAVGLGFSIISCVFSFTYLKVTIDDLVIGQASVIEKKFLFPFLTIYLIISIAFVFILVILGRHLSHRTAGPLHAFEVFLEDIMAGKDRPFKLRAGDEFSHLEEIAEKIRIKMKSKAKDEDKEGDLESTLTHGPE